MSDLYGVLELEKTATADEIKSSYRRLAMKWHPDRNGGSVEAEEKFKRISEAYSVLSDEVKRAEYDAALAGGRSEQTEGAFEGGYWRDFGSFSRERAADMFMNEMYMLAVELTMQNVGWRDIAQELVRRGCPAQVAADIARKIETRRKATVRGNAAPYFVRSAISGFAGFCLFVLFGGVGLGILGFIGLLMLVNGVYNLARALYFMTTGKAPRSLIM
jgi:DnaJ-class molecular chaperone